MYSRLLASYPLLTKSITSGFMFSLGDILTQKLIEKKESINWRRNLTLILTGTYYLGPCLHFWYSRFLPRLTTKVVGQSATKYTRAFTGMVFDQLAFAPVFLCGFFIVAGFNSTFTIKGAEQGFDDMKSKIKETLFTNWKIWPLATLTNLTFVPMQFQVLFANFIGLFWNMYLSYISYR